MANPKSRKKNKFVVSRFSFPTHQKGFWSVLVLSFLFHRFAAKDCLFELKENTTEKQNRKTKQNKQTRKNEQTQRQNSQVHFRKHWPEIWFFLNKSTRKNEQTQRQNSQVHFRKHWPERFFLSLLETNHDSSQTNAVFQIWAKNVVCMKVLEDRLGVLILESANLIVKIIISCAWLNSLCGFGWSVVKFFRQFELCWLKGWPKTVFLKEHLLDDLNFFVGVSLIVEDVVLIFIFTFSRQSSQSTKLIFFLFLKLASFETKNQLQKLVLFCFVLSFMTIWFPFFFWNLELFFLIE